MSKTELFHKLKKAKEKKTEGRDSQYKVHLGVEPSHKSSNYHMWTLGKKELGHVLKNWDKVKWDKAGFGKKSRTNENFHSTTVARNSPSAPLTRALKESGGAEHKRALYHGVGRDEPGLAALNQHGPTEAFDPYHPDESIRKQPKGKFDSIHSHYTLNVVDKDTGHDILTQIHKHLSDGGKASISVRADKSLDKLDKNMSAGYQMGGAGATGMGALAKSSLRKSTVDTFKKVTAGFMHPSKNKTGILPGGGPTPPKDRKHIRADTQTNQDFVLEKAGKDIPSECTSCSKQDNYSGTPGKPVFKAKNEMGTWWDCPSCKTTGLVADKDKMQSLEKDKGDDNVRSIGGGKKKEPKLESRTEQTGKDPRTGLTAEERRKKNRSVMRDQNIRGVGVKGSGTQTMERKQELARKMRDEKSSDNAGLNSNNRRDYRDDQPKESAADKFKQRIANHQKQKEESVQLGELNSKKEAMYRKHHGDEMWQHSQNHQSLPAGEAKRIPGSDKKVSYHGEKDGHHYFSVKDSNSYNSHPVKVKREGRKVHLENIPHQPSGWEAESPDSEKRPLPRGSKAALSVVKKHPAYAEAMGRKTGEDTHKEGFHPKDFEIKQSQNYGREGTRYTVNQKYGGKRHSPSFVHDESTNTVHNPYAMNDDSSERHRQVFEHVLKPHLEKLGHSPELVSGKDYEARTKGIKIEKSDDYQGNKKPDLDKVFAYLHGTDHPDFGKPGYQDSEGTKGIPKPADKVEKAGGGSLGKLIERMKKAKKWSPILSD